MALGVVVKYYLFSAFGLILVGFLAEQGRDAQALVAFVICGIVQYIFRCPRCRRPIVNYKNTWIAFPPGRICSNCGAGLT